MTLKDIECQKEILLSESKYLTTFVKVVDMESRAATNKSGKEINLKVLTGYSEGRLIEVTIWNMPVESNLLNQWVLLDGFRLKKLTEKHFVLTSTVYSKMPLCDWDIQDEYQPEKHSEYENLSNVYENSTLEKLASMELTS